MKFILMFLIILSCEKSNRDTTELYSLPKEMRDCKIFKLNDSRGGSMIAIHCPSSTQFKYKCGKSCVKNVFVNR